VDLSPKSNGFKTERLDATRPEDISRAAEILRSGGLVAFPTETVYGLGANALSAEAVEKIFIAKQRPHWDPLIVHISDQEMLSLVWDQKNSVILSGAIAPSAIAESKNPDANRTATAVRTFPPQKAVAEAQILALIKNFWPGPLTLLLPKTKAIPDSVTAGRPLVGVRMPAHPVALELIRQAGVPIAAPSANTFGHTSPTTAAHVLADLDGRIDAVLDGGPTTVGLESTVIGFGEIRRSGRQNIVIYRPGAITDSMLEDIHGLWVVDAYLPDAPKFGEPSSLPSPGFGLRHYAPRARLILVEEDRDNLVRRGHPVEDILVEPIDQAFDGIQQIGVMLPKRWNRSCAQLIFDWGSWEDGETLAQRLFAGLRDLDDRGATIIIAPVPTIPGIGEAIRDRLQKAARPA
jgi:L-threonylcarbamoyladenylate synthase